MRKLFYTILRGVNIFFGISLLLSYLAVHINPGNFSLPALFGLAYPYLLLINILLVIIWSMLLKFEALASAVIIAAGFNHFSNYLQLTRPHSDKVNTFKVLSYNIHLFNYFDKNYPGTEKNILDFVRKQSPDVLCLQDFFTEGDPIRKEQVIKTSLGGKYNSHLKVLGNGKNRFYGIATFTVYPIISRGEVIHPGSSSLTIYTDVLIQNDTFRIYNSHLQSFRLREMERSLLEEMSILDDEKRLEEVRNLSKSLKKGFSMRALQAQNVKNNMNRSPYPVIVAGDFNDTPVSYSYRKLRKGLNDSFVNSGYGAGFTYRGNYPPNRIDYILYDNRLVNSYFEIIKIKYSDHYPIVAYFRNRH